MQADHWRCRPSSLVQVVSAQTLGRRIGKGGYVDHHLQDLRFVLIDECHTLYQSTLDWLAKLPERTAVIGLSATPFAAGLKDVYETVINVATTDELIASRTLVRPIIYAAVGPPRPLPSLAERRAEEDRTARRAAEKARQMVKAATMATHPYLERKGFPKAIGLVLDEKLLVPAYVGRDLVSLQEIAADGSKKNLPGGRMSGAHFSIGNGSLEVLCEGYATGLSIRAALGAIHMPGRVTCCFSASNVAEVASRKRHAIIIADNDRPLPQFGGVGAGEYYAKKSGLAYAMPPDVGDDANDLGAMDIFTLQDILLDLMQRRRP